MTIPIEDLFLFVLVLVDGLCARVIAKITSVTLRVFLREFFGIDVLTYTVRA